MPVYSAINENRKQKIENNNNNNTLFVLTIHWEEGDMEEFVVQYLHTKIVFKIGQGQNYPKMVLYLGE